MCYPSDVIVKGDHTFIPNWAMFFVLEVEEYMKRGGEREIVDALKPRVEGIIAFLSRYENEDGLLENLPGWIFVEWSQANKLVDGVNYPSNMLWAETLVAAGRLCWRMDWYEKARKVREKVREQSFDGEFFRDHAVRVERPSRSDEQRADTTLEVRPDRTETCQYYAFYFGVADFKRDAALWNRLVRRDFGDLAKSNAFIGNLMRMELLARDGRRDQMREEIKRYYLKMADSTGTLWEHDAPHASCCHAFSSFLTVLLDGDEADDLAAATATSRRRVGRSCAAGGVYDKIKVLWTAEPQRYLPCMNLTTYPGRVSTQVYVVMQTSEAGRSSRSAATRRTRRLPKRSARCVLTA